MRNTGILQKHKFWERKKWNPISHIKEAFITSPRSGRTIALSVLILMIIKLFVVSLVFGVQIQDPSILHRIFYYLGFLANDFIIFGIILFFVFLNLISKRRWLKILGNTISLILLLLFFVDIITIYYFQGRLSIFDLSSFLTFSNGASFLVYIALGVGIFFAFLAVLFFFVQKYFSRTKDRDKQLIFAIWFFVFSLFFSLINFVSSQDKDLQTNILLLNVQAIGNLINGNSDFSSIQNMKYGPSYESYFKEIQGQRKRMNIILVIAESFSTVDSQRAGGLYDNFPFFDKVQADGITFTNFMANGCTSETAHIALLQGVEPWQNPLEKPEAAYDNYANYTDVLPAFFNNLGYHTTFLSTVTLGFLNERDFIKKVQFQDIIGEEYFRNEIKYVFDAAPDNVLYNKALQIIKSGEADTKQPFFLAMQTVSSHKPYNTPAGTSEASMFSYVDRSVYAFYQKLKKTGFFDNGILVIVGDHRKMVAIPTEEFKTYGLTAHSRALATIIGSGVKANQIDPSIIQDIDIFYSLKYLFGSGKVLVRKDFNNVFNPSQENRDRGVRYCRFSDKHYAVLQSDNQGYVLRPGMNPYVENYITAFKRYQYQQLIGTGYDSLYFDNFVTGTGKADDFTIIAHRGDPIETADNSLKGFELAKENHADGIEFDLSLTKDGYNVVLHGPTLAQTTCGRNKYVYDYTLADLIKTCKLDNGESIMTFDDMMSQTKGWFNKYFVELKVYDTTKAEAQALDAINTVNVHGMQDQVIFTSYDKIANYIIGSYKGITAGWDTFSSGNVAMVGNFPHKYFLTDEDAIDEETIKTMQMLNKEVVVYTVNTTGDFDKIYNLGIREIMTDDVPLIKQLVRQYESPIGSGKQPTNN